MKAKGFGLLAVAILVLATVLSGCGGGTASAPSATPAASTPPPPTAKTSVQTTTEASAAAGTTAITSDQAKATALNDAGMAEADVQKLKVEQDTENGTAVYDVSFKVKGTDYDYDIDANTGAILNRKVEADD